MTRYCAPDGAQGKASGERKDFMKITVAGQDRTELLGGEIAGQAARFRADPRLQPLPPGLDSVALRELESPAAFDLKFLELMRHKAHVDTLPFEIPRKPGLAGGIMGAMRKALWKLLRYQHDRMAARQNTINSWLISALEHGRAETQAELAQLRERLDRLERGEGSR
jgi:hypothetical protein